MNLSSRTIKRNQKLLIAIIEYLQKKDFFEEINIYTNGRKYSSTKHPGDTVCQTKYGEYYDCGEWDVEKQIEYNNPETLTMTFEGPLYHNYNATSMYPSKTNSEEDINNICKKFGLYAEQGYAWSLACYDL